MTDPGERDAPDLVDEIFGTASVPEPREPTDSPDTPDAWDGTLDTVPVRRRRRRRMPGAETLGCRDVALTTAGFAVFVLIDVVMMYTPFRMRDEPSLLPQLLTLVLLAFGLGGLLVWQVRGIWRPFGIGLMLGWVFATLISAGFLTGLNP
ncbi:MAG: hypothetical protein ACRDOO_11610 [Actinomadura sp.]